MIGVCRRTDFANKGHGSDKRADEGIQGMKEAHRMFHLPNKLVREALNQAHSKIGPPVRFERASSMELSNMCRGLADETGGKRPLLRGQGRTGKRQFLFVNPAGRKAWPKTYAPSLHALAW